MGKRRADQSSSVSNQAAAMRRIRERGEARVAGAAVAGADSAPPARIGAPTTSSGQACQAPRSACDQQAHGDHALTRAHDEVESEIASRSGPRMQLLATSLHKAISIASHNEARLGHLRSHPEGDERTMRLAADAIDTYRAARETVEEVIQLLMLHGKQG